MFCSCRCKQPSDMELALICCVMPQFMQESELVCWYCSLSSFLLWSCAVLQLSSDEQCVDSISLVSFVNYCSEIESVLFELILCKNFTMAIAEKLLILRCIKPKSIESKMLILCHQFATLGLTSNTVPYIIWKSGLCIPNSKTLLVILHTWNS
jgi:hypothetical protein